jgi:ribonuclease HII
MRLLPYLQTDFLEAGCDEAGRGCLAGPVVAAAVVLDPEKEIQGLNDSKKLKASSREELSILIKADALTWAVGVVSPQEIDEINILNASFLAMHRALDQLAFSPEYLLIDGNRFTPYKDLPFACVIQGDGRYQNMAAASILAKCYRDELMQGFHEEYPVYGWSKNMGYPTVAHKMAIREHGLTPHHRRTFRSSLTAKQLKLPL